MATVGEAEVFADAGFTDLFIAYPIWAFRWSGDRLRALASRAQLRVGVDSLEGIALLSRVGRRGDGRARQRSPPHRCPAGRRRRHCRGSPATPGWRSPASSPSPATGTALGCASEAAADEALALGRAAGLLAEAGIDAPVLSGGSTPTAAIAEPVPHRAAAGHLPFYDAQQVELGVADFAQVALTAASTVVHRSDRSVVLDAGSKVLGADQPAWATGAGRLPDYPDARIVLLSEHHAKVVFPDDSALPELGSVVRVAPNHVCAAVNLADELVVVQGGSVVDTWQVAARGRNR